MAPNTIDVLATCRTESSTDTTLGLNRGIEVTSGNSTLIQSQVASLLVQSLEQASTFLAACPVVLDSSSPVRVPRIVNGVTAGFVAEGAQITDGDVAFDATL